jgi:Putative rhamnosyl transferase
VRPLVRTVLREITPPGVVRLARLGRPKKTPARMPVEIVTPSMPRIAATVPTFAHYIVTRYNLGLFSGGFFGDRVKDPEGWMRHRFPLFHWTVGSIRQQTCQDFTWLVAVDPKTPERCLSEISGILPANAEVCFADDVSLTDLRHSDGAPFVWPDVEMLVTSRVDNDDVLLPGFVRAVQSNLGPKAKVLDSLGWVQEVESGAVRLPNFEGDPGSMFVTLAETDQPFRTVVAYEHWQIVEFFPTTMIQERLWMIRIHQSNLSNNRAV